MSELKEVGRIVANAADDLVPLLILDADVPSINTSTEAKNAIDRVVTQDLGIESKRNWAAGLGLLAAVLAVPEVQSLMGPWAPVVTAISAAILARWSKARDPRPTR